MKVVFVEQMAQEELVVTELSNLKYTIIAGVIIRDGHE